MRVGFGFGFVLVVGLGFGLGFGWGLVAALVDGESRMLLGGRSALVSRG
jgi:hypothetical protein